MFTEIKDATVLVKNKLGYKELNLYKRNDNLYAKNGTYYISILAAGVTSNANLSWIEICGCEYVNEKGKLVVS